MEHPAGPARGLSEIVLVVKDVALAARFYREVVGLTPITEPNERWAWFRVDAAGAQYLAVTTGPLLFEEHSPHPAGRRWGPVHFALRVDRAELGAAAARVRAHGIEVHGPQRLEWMGAESYYFYDPDGNLVEWWARGEGD